MLGFTYALATSFSTCFSVAVLVLAYYVTTDKDFFEVLQLN